METMSSTYDEDNMSTLSPSSPKTSDRRPDTGASATPAPPHSEQPPPPLLSLYHWPECSALVCTACKAEEPLGEKRLLCKADALSHLQTYHHFAQTKALSELLDSLSPLAQTPDQFESPISGRPPRPFLAPPQPQWCCNDCGFIAKSQDVFAAHLNYRHYYQIGSPKLIGYNESRFYVQEADDYVFSVLYTPTEAKLSLSEPNPSTEVDYFPEPLFPGVPDYIRSWTECRAIICISCRERPLLCKDDLLVHLRDHHADFEESEPSPEVQRNLSLPKWDNVATDIGDLRSPIPYQTRRYFLQDPVQGYACAALPCQFAHHTLEAVVQHEIQVHSSLQEEFEQRMPVFVQSVLRGETRYFPVKWERLLGPVAFPALSTVPELPEYDMPARTIPIRSRMREFSSEELSIGEHSIRSIGNMTFQSALRKPLPKKPKRRRKGGSKGDPFSYLYDEPGPETTDRYTDDERRQILQAIYVKPNPTDADFEPLDSGELEAKIRELAYKDGLNAVQEVRKFTRPLMHAILRTQHEIVTLEEKNSWGLQTELDNEVLENSMITYSNLIQAYKDLTSNRQPNKDRTRAFGRFFATELREPRYWYDPDALDLIDLNVHGTRQSTDSVRVFLQRMLPKRFLDKEGRERRALEQMTREKELPGAGMAKIIDAHLRHGQYISPITDRTARILFAIVGGILLLIPMIAMTFIQAEHYLLLTTSLFVLIFAVLVAFASNASNQELLAVTAAYAAVLVVFVGNAIAGEAKEST